jgi:hypothetical protein
MSCTVNHGDADKSFEVLQTYFDSLKIPSNTARMIEQETNHAFPEYDMSVYYDTDAKDMMIKYMNPIISLSWGCGADRESLKKCIDMCLQDGDAIVLCTLHAGSYKRKRMKGAVLLRLHSCQQIVTIILLCCSPGLGIGSHMVSAIKNSYSNCRIFADATRHALPFWYKMGFEPEHKYQRERFRAYFRESSRAPENRDELISVDDWTGGNRDQLKLQNSTATLVWILIK